MKYCLGCGEKKRIRWYGFCTKDCAATRGLAIVELEQRMGEGYCSDCGERWRHVADCPLNDEEEE